jgi:hypothetical protein
MLSRHAGLVGRGGRIETCGGVRDGGDRDARELNSRLSWKPSSALADSIDEPRMVETHEDVARLPLSESGLRRGIS